MAQKDTPFTVLDTHAGAGLYRLDGDYAQISAEAAQGFVKLMAAQAAGEILTPVVQDYADMVASFNTGPQARVYPGSPFIIQQQLRGRDKLKAFELHPTDAKTLAANIAQLEAGRQVARSASASRCTMATPACKGRRSGRAVTSSGPTARSSRGTT